MTTKQALAFVHKHGVVLEAGRGIVPSLVEAIAGGPIRGSWWSHAMGHEIFALTRAVRGAEDILVCRLIEGKVTFVHRRLWPALVRLAPRLPRDRLAYIEEVHTPSGKHVTREVPYPAWVPREIRKAARDLGERDAYKQLGRKLTEKSAQANKRPQRVPPSRERGR